MSSLALSEEVTKHCFVRAQENLHFRKFQSGYPYLIQKIIDFLLRRGYCLTDTCFFPAHAGVTGGGIEVTGTPPVTPARQRQGR